MTDSKNNDFLSYVALVEEQAASLGFDGHYTVMRFTTHYKGCYGSVDSLSDEDREAVRLLQPFPSLPTLMRSMAKNPDIHILPTPRPTEPSVEWLS